MELQRVYSSVISYHLDRLSQMAFISGPRQVGKTTTFRAMADAYVNWDDYDGRALVLAGPRRLVGELSLDRLAERNPVVMFDELHKFPQWKTFLKGLFDTYGNRLRIIVTGSSRLSVYRRGGDSLMGRYFSYRMHPLSVSELCAAELSRPAVPHKPPRELSDEDYDALWQFGGFPEPYVRREARFWRRWKNLRFEQLIREDVRDFTQIQQLNQLEVLARLLAADSGRQLVYANLARQIRTSIDTVRRWIVALSNMHYGFVVRPWYRNLSRSLRKEPKWYVRDWTLVEDAGLRAETFVACHLLKAVDGWNDLGLGEFQLRYLRDKEGREVDFIVIRDGQPWCLVEAKLTDTSIGRQLANYQERLGAPFAFQVVVELDHVQADSFAQPGPPLVVPARSFLSQLL